jgi:16S rRNA (adenine1518-N6/adenine1519-N6)-dimethyltransferase
VQKEVAERIQAAPGGKDYGALTLAVRFYADVFLAANVPPNCFIPRPDVSSAVITLKKRETPAYETKDKALLFRLIRAGFANRRKTLMNNLRNAPDLSLSKERAEEAVRFLGKGEQVRGEALDLSDYVRLSNFLSTEEGA